jgi:acyl-homoserine-lactone acylase
MLTIPKKTLAYILLLLLASCDTHTRFNKTEILWDNYGVPHIYGKNTAAMYYAYGWAQMNNHANLILQLYGQARGCAAEYWGEQYLKSDKEILIFNLPDIAKTTYQLQKPEYRSYLDAFVKGMNDYVRTHARNIDKSAMQVLPVTVYDVLAHMMRVIYLKFLASNDLYQVNNALSTGSNAYAIAPSRTASKNAMLVSNPHLPWYDLYMWFEAQLQTAGFKAYGVTLVGIPCLAIAFNDHLGWTITLNQIDACDRYELALKDTGYVLDGKITPFHRKTLNIKVKHSNGTFHDQKLEFRYSKHGPVLGQKGDKAYAIRIAGLQNAMLFEQYHQMAAAKNLTEFESALKMMQNPMFNIIYADISGNILYLFNGNIPVRNEGDFSFWNNVIDGTQTKFIWSRIHAYNDLPRVLNPPSGFLQNCNDPPWTCTYPAALDPDKFPAYMSPLGMHLRAQRAVNMIKDIPAISFDQLTEIKMNTGMESANRFLDDLLTAVEKFPDPTALKAAAVLKTWDRRTDSSSKGALLFAAWWDQINSSMFAVHWNKDNPVLTPDGLADQKLAVELLIHAANGVQEKYGSLDAAWGDFNRFRINGVDYPANGGPEQYGIFRVIFFNDDSYNKKRAVAGDSYVAITEFGKEIKAQVLLSYGNATQPGNKHIGDQLKLLSEKKLRPALLKRADIMKNLEKREVLNSIGCKL